MCRVFIKKLQEHQQTLIKLSEMKKLFLVILACLSLGISAQEIRYVTVPTSQEETVVPALEPVKRQEIVQKNTVNEIQSSGLTPDVLKNSQTKARNTTFIKNKFKDNWFISIGGGLAYLESEQSRYVALTDAMKPTVSFAVGKWVNPIVGIRFSVTAAKLQGFSEWHNRIADPNDPNYNPAAWGHGNWYIGKNYEDPLESLAGRSFTNTYMDASYGNLHDDFQNPLFKDIAVKTGEYIEETFLEMDKPRHTSNGSDGYDYFLTYAAGSFDLMLNVNNLFGCYKPNRFFNFNIFGGVGYSHTFKEEKWVDDPNREKVGKRNAAGQVERSKSAVNSIMAKAGFEMNFRLSEQMTFNIEPNLLVLPEFFDRRVGDGNTMDGVYNVLAGFTYKFKERYFYEPICNEKQVIINNIINEVRADDDILARLKRIEAALQQPVPLRQIDTEHLKVVVHFIIDKWEVRQSEMYKLDEIAKFMNKYPRVRVSISGYADVQTAYPAYNLKLSENRAKEVSRILATKYGIDKSRLRIEHYGDTVQPFDINELNRAVIAFDLPEN